MKNGGSTDSRRTACASAGRAVRPFQRHDFAPCFAVRSVGPCGLCLQNVSHTVSPLLGCISASSDGATTHTAAGFLAPVACRSGLQRMNENARPSRSPVGVSAPGAGDHAPPLRLGCRWERRRHFHAAAFAGSASAGMGMCSRAPARLNRSTVCAIEWIFRMKGL